MARAWTRCRTVALRLRDSRRDVLPPPRAALHLGALRRWCLSQTAQTREALPPYATLQHRASTLILVEEIVPLNAEKVNGLGCFSRDSPGAARKPGHRPTDRPPAGSGGCGHPPLHARTAVFHCRGAFYMRPRRRLAGNCSRPGCTNGGLIQFIHSSFKECFLFCYRSFKIFQGFSGMIMPSGGHKQAPLSIIDASFLFLLFFFFLFSLFSFSLKHRPHGACRAVCVLSGAQSAPRNSSVTPV